MFTLGQRNISEPNTRDSATVVRSERRVHTCSRFSMRSTRTRRPFSRSSRRHSWRSTRHSRLPQQLSGRMYLYAGLMAGAQMVLFAPKGAVSFESGRFSGLDGCFVEGNFGYTAGGCRRCRELHLRKSLWTSSRQQWTCYVPECGMK